jgi:hypothetical protein
MSAVFQNPNGITASTLGAASKIVRTKEITEAIFSPYWKFWTQFPL